ncbi:MAG: cation transporter [Bdellovibrionaceae bacterium]|nr:cation transporter [Pseudobdellovibrionaceae bacterium]
MIHQTATLNQRLRVAKLNIAVSFVVLALKYTGYYFSGSSAIYSDAVETLINVLTAFTALVVIHFVAMPADENHPYGHGKLEFFSAAFEGGLVFFAAVSILIEGVQAFKVNQPLVQIETGMVFIFIASLVNFFMSLALKRVGEKEKSVTLIASSAHLMSDVYTTAGVLVGLFLVKLTGLIWIDAVVSFLVAAHLLVESYKIVRRSVSGLTDEMDSESLQELSEAIKKNVKPGVINIHLLRAIRSGNFHHIDAHLIVPEFWDVAKAHRFTDDFEKKVVEDYPYDGEFAFHLDPCGRKYCSYCDIDNCPVRQTAFVKHFSFDSHDIIKSVNESYVRVPLAP